MFDDTSHIAHAALLHADRPEIPAVSCAEKQNVGQQTGKKVLEWDRIFCYAGRTSQRIESHAMIKPQMSGMPGIGAVTDTMDFVKNLWGMMGVPGMNMPGMVVPTLSVEELDKKIEDLKAVESWLNVNMSMLRGTIQALEVQRATIATLKAMGDSFGEAVNKAQSSNKSSSEQSAFSSAFSFPDFPKASPAAKKPPSAAPQPPAPQEAAPSDPPTEHVAEQKRVSQQPDAAPQTVNPAAWWNVLQDQFKQAVDTAMASEPAAKAAVNKKNVKPPVKPPVKPAKTPTSVKPKPATTKSKPPKP